MPVKIRLTRKGRKRNPYYHIVIADSRAPRDGRYIERIGFYNPTTNPATIEIDFDRALEWLQKGAQPTDTCRAILSYKGVLMKKHLLEGVKKNAFSEEEAENRFKAWLKEKEGKIQDKKDRIAKGKEADMKKRLETEAKIREERAQLIAKKNAELAEDAAKEPTAKETDTDDSKKPSEVVEETISEKPVETREDPEKEKEKEEQPTTGKDPEEEKSKETKDSAVEASSDTGKNAGSEEPVGKENVKEKEDEPSQDSEKTNLEELSPDTEEAGKEE
ncbi:MAG: 30S ribosomal protein S16 [Bacteroidales bacterium]|nr:MAG: 30S ribosomal protein S16 [Bacteroidales bacterium]